MCVANVALNLEDVSSDVEGLLLHVDDVVIVGGDVGEYPVYVVIGKDEGVVEECRNQPSDFGLPFQCSLRCVSCCVERFLVRGDCIPQSCDT